MTDDSDVFGAIAHPVRRGILDTLRTKDRTVTDLAEPYGMSRPAVSQHLKVLLDAGLVARRKVGRENYYTLRPARLNEAYRWLAEYEQFWTDKLNRLEDYLRQEDEENPTDAT